MHHLLLWYIDFLALALSSPHPPLHLILALCKISGGGGGSVSQTCPLYTTPLHKWPSLCFFISFCASCLPRPQATCKLPVEPTAHVYLSSQHVSLLSQHVSLPSQPAFLLSQHASAFSRAVLSRPSIRLYVCLSVSKKKYLAYVSLK